jgi:hypothetical protein
MTITIVLMVIFLYRASGDAQGIYIPFGIGHIGKIRLETLMHHYLG